MKKIMFCFAIMSSIALWAISDEESLRLKKEGVMAVGSDTLAHGQNTYTPCVGEKGSQRLDLQQSIWGNDSKNHLLEAGLQKGQLVIDLGCGNGVMTTWLAKQVGPEGHVIAVDQSQAQLELAKKRAEDEGIDNIEFLLCDACALELPPNTADIVYCRFLLIHLQDPFDVIIKVSSFLKQGGVFVAQEPINSDCHLYPEDQMIMELFRTYLRKLSFRHGVDYDLGKKLPLLFWKAGYFSVRLHYSQRGVSVPVMKDLLLKCYEETKQAALGSGSCSEVEHLEQVRLMRDYPEQQAEYYVCPRQVHVTAQKY